jgi:hypothetical protein
MKKIKSHLEFPFSFSQFKTNFCSFVQPQFIALFYGHLMWNKCFSDPSLSEYFVEKRGQ